MKFIKLVLLNVWNKIWSLDCDIWDECKIDLVAVFREGRGPS